MRDFSAIASGGMQRSGPHGRRGSETTQDGKDKRYMIQYRRELWKLVKTVPGGIAEIGVAEGNFSRDMLNWPIDFSTLYCVDRWTCVPGQRGDAAQPQAWHDRNYQLARQKTFSTKISVHFLQGDSVAMAMRVPAKSLRLVYIDADHSYDGVIRDIRAWYPKLVQGGVMAFHDYLNPRYGVHSAVNDFCREEYLTLNTLSEDKPEDAGAWFFAHGYVDPMT